MAEKSVTDTMQYINNQLKTGEFDSVYLLYGRENYLVDDFLGKLIKALVGDSLSDNLNYNEYNGDSVNIDEVCDIAVTLPFFADRRVVVYKNSGLFKKNSDIMVKTIDSLPDTTTIIFTEMDREKVDGRNKLFKTIKEKGSACEFDFLDTSMLMKWLNNMFIDKSIKIDSAALKKLVVSVGNDMNMLYNEAQKLMGYCIEKGVATEKDVDDICTSQVQDKVFLMLEEIAMKNRDRALKYYNDLLTLKAAPVNVIRLITRHYRILGEVKLKGNSNNATLAKTIGVPVFSVQKYEKQSEQYSYDEIVIKIERCVEAYHNITTGIQRDGVALEMLVLENLI